MSRSGTSYALEKANSQDSKVSFIRRLLMHAWQTRLPKELPLLPPHPQAQLLSRSTTSWVYAAPSLVPRQAYKLSRDAAQLKQQFNLHNKLNAIFDAVATAMWKRGRPVSLPYVPVCFDWYPDIFSTEYADSFRSLRQLPRPCAAYTMEYIQPLHHHYVRYLIKRHVSCRVQEEALANARSSHNVVQVCVGNLRPLTDAWNAAMHSRSVYIDHLFQEGVDFNQVAAAMGSALAILHWSCGVDGAGVQFLLGCDLKGRVQLWMTGFSHCRPFEKNAHDVKARLVDAVMENGSVWPRWIDIWPFSSVWLTFKRAYFQMSLFVFSDKRVDNERVFLPLLFLQSLALQRGPEASFSSDF